MTGWAMLAVIALLAAAVLALLRFPRALWTVAATGLTLGAAGYAWQGSPGLAGNPVERSEDTREIDPGLIAMREAMFGRFNLEDSYFRVSDAMARSSGAGMAAQAMQGAVRKYPTDFALWTWFGVTLTAQDRGMVSPASRFAFERGMALAPRHPGPAFFYGLALAEGGQPAEARRYWAQAVALAPEKAPYRPILIEQLARLDAAIAAQGGPQPAPQSQP
jgi:hypothetical protein